MSSNKSRRTRTQQSSKSEPNFKPRMILSELTPQRKREMADHNSLFHLHLTPISKTKYEFISQKRKTEVSPSSKKSIKELIGYLTKVNSSARKSVKRSENLEDDDPFDIFSTKSHQSAGKFKSCDFFKKNEKNKKEINFKNFALISKEKAKNEIFRDENEKKREFEKKKLKKDKGKMSEEGLKEEKNHIEDIKKKRDDTKLFKNRKRKRIIGVKKFKKNKEENKENNNILKEFTEKSKRRKKSEKSNTKKIKKIMKKELINIDESVLEVKLEEVKGVDDSFKLKKQVSSKLIFEREMRLKSRVRKRDKKKDGGKKKIRDFLY